MDTVRNGRRGSVALALVCAVGLLVASCSSSSGSDASTTTADSGAATTEGDGPETTEAADATTTTVSEAAAGEGGDLIGMWTADAGDLLEVNTGNIGGAPSIDCSGPINLTFGTAGTFRQDGTASCTVAGQTATATFDNRGTYEAADGTVTVLTAENFGTIDIAGISQPIDSGFEAGSATYTVEGDTLTVTFTDPSVETVTQTYTRA